MKQEPVQADTVLKEDKCIGTEESCFEDSAYSCNICLEISKEPVVTLCGHLFCWPCLFRWVPVLAGML